ncbi:telomere length regulation protein [Ceratocystis pirilliformis]|uniref:Small ribosomal subunit protein mS41 n=1 Tax=Ceratocystis pirilliformis TaxID=259994 RepID=A0ABR3ZG38_9PEZI
MASLRLPRFFASASFRPVPASIPASAHITSATVRQLHASQASCNIPQTSAASLSAPGSSSRVPAPIPLIPDVPTFLRAIGRDLVQYADKFPSWEALFTLSSEQLRELGVEPARSRKYLLQWLQRYRNGELGPGGDFKYVEDGKATLVVDHDLGTDVKKVVNVPYGKTIEEAGAEKVRVRGYSVKGAQTISGPYALPSGRETATMTVVDRMWEFRQGQKVDGGERRKTEIRFKRRIAERRARREAEEGR